MLKYLFELRMGPRGGGHMKKGVGFLKNIVWLTQLGLSVAAPIVLCVWLTVWLRDRFALGGWVVVIGVVLGVGAAFVSLWQSLREMDRQAKEDDGDHGVGFNEHK